MTYNQDLGANLNTHDIKVGNQSNSVDKIQIMDQKMKPLKNEKLSKHSLSSEEDDDFEAKCCDTGSLKEKNCAALCILLYLCWGINTSTVGPFFPTEAEKRKISRSIIGLITATLMISQWFFAIVFFFAASERNKRTIFYIGFIAAGLMCIAFGEASRFDDNDWFIPACFLTRVVIGFGGASTWSTGAPIVIPFFPKKVGLIFSMLEVSTAIGMMIGPIITSYLFSLGGYRLPFLSVGLFELFLGFLCFLSIKSVQNREKLLKKVPEHSKGSMVSVLSVGQGGDTEIDFKSAFRFLTLPGLWVITFPLLAVLSQFGFLQVALAPYLLSEFEIDGTQSGQIFLVHAGLSAITCFIYGVLIDKGFSKITFIISLVFTSFGYFALGAPVLGFNYPKATLYVGLSILGLTSYGGYLPCYFIFEQIAHRNNFINQEKLRIYICTWVTFCYSFGLISGQFFVGGLFYAYYDFHQSNLLLSLLTLLSGLVAGAYLLVLKTADYRADKEAKRLKGGAENIEIIQSHFVSV